MADIFTTGIVNLGNGDVTNCRRLRLPIRFVDSETQQTEIENFEEGSQRGRVQLAVKTNVAFSSPQQESEFWEGVMMRLAQLRLENGDA